MSVNVYLINEENGMEILLGGEGKYTLGRGPLVKITDKRVSRNHAILSVDDKGNVKLCPKHTNPFFHSSSVSGQFVTLERNIWHTLKDKDKISFIPNDLIYTVKIKSDKDNDADDRFTDSSLIPAVEKKDETAKSEFEEIKTDKTSSEDLSKPVSKTLSEDDVSSSISQSLDNTARKRNLPGWLKDVQLKKRVEEKVVKRSRKAPEKPKPSHTSSVVIPRKRKISEDSIEEVPVKKTTKSVVSESDIGKTISAKDTRPSAVSISSEDSSIRKDEKKRPSSEDSSIRKDEKNRPSSEDSSIRKDEKNRPSSEDSSIRKDEKRPICPYGKKCYRKNPAHFKEFSHNDVEDEKDDEDDDRPECEYGTDCYRRNPLHLSEYKHTAPPLSNPGEKRTRTSSRKRGEKKPKKSVLTGDSDDEDEPNTYDYHDSFIDDERIGDSSSSYGADSEEDEDWAPIENNEDVEELVNDAKSFMSNKKMHRPM